MFNINIWQNPKHPILICALVISVAASSLYEKFSNRLPAVCLERNHPISSIRLVVCGDSLIPIIMGCASSKTVEEEVRGEGWKEGEE